MTEPTMVERMRRAFISATMKMERDVKVDDLTDAEIDELMRSALSGAREPTEAMMAIAIPRPSYWSPEGENAVKDKIMETDRRDRANHWRAMIDAALAEAR